MRVPPIDTFGRFGVPKYSKNKKSNYNTSSMIKPIRQDTVTFGSTAQYLKKYVTLPDEIKRVLTPADAIDMFKDMEWLAQGRIKRSIIGEGNTTALYENPWLEDYYLLIVKNPDKDDEVVVCYNDKIGDSVWQDGDNQGIQLLRKFD